MDPPRALSTNRVLVRACAMTCPEVPVALDQQPVLPRGRTGASSAPGEFAVSVPHSKRGAGRKARQPSP
jgi:hypothetical protein